MSMTRSGTSSERDAETGLGSPPDAGGAPLLQVQSLRVEIDTEAGRIVPVQTISFSLRRGEVLGIVGETGCGKSISALSLMGLLPPRARVASGQCHLGKTDLLALSERELRKIRGKRVGMIFQDPLTSLNPVMTVGAQLVETMRIHEKRPRGEHRAKAAELLGAVRIPDPKRILRAYPHELSGGMRQRVMIAMAISNDPELLIADEPTTALDVTTQAQILEVLRVARERTNSGMILITHDLGIVADHAQQVMVMYDGRVVESGPTEAVLADPRHPYTRALLAARPSLEGSRVPVPIAGMPPRPWERSVGCSFAPRCVRCDPGAACIESPPDLEALIDDTRHQVACYLPQQRTDGGSSEQHAEVIERRDLAGGEELLRTTELSKSFAARRRILSNRDKRVVQAVDRVTLAVGRGETLAIVGESGSGKSTTARSVIRLIEPSGGSINFDGANVGALSTSALRAFRQQAQIVLQDPFSALDPRKSVGQSIAEPLRTHRMVPRKDEETRVGELLSSVGLHREYAKRYPHELSGGQRQRVCIARAIALEPKLLVLDEPVSALDVSVQAQILDLLRALQQTHDIAYLLITHDLAVVRSLATRVAIFYLGRVVEEGAVGDVFERPRHPYTRLLLDAVPGQRHDHRTERVPDGDPPDPANRPTGCAFNPRCPHASEICCRDEPVLIANLNRSGAVACHFPASD